MKKLNVKPTHRTPRVIGGKDFVLIEGRSISTNLSFFDKAEDFIKENEEVKLLNLGFDLLNTKTIKRLEKLLKTFKETNRDGLVFWTFEKGCEDMEDIGQELEDVFGKINFNPIGKEDFRNSINRLLKEI